MPGGWDGAGNVKNYDGVTTGDNCCSKQTDFDPGAFDTMFTTMCNAVENCIALDGQTKPTANIAWGSQRISNIGSATLLTDATAANVVVNSSLVNGGTSGGSANAQTITLTIAPTAYVSGQVITFKAGFTNTSSTTINVNGLGAKTVLASLYGNAAVLLGREIRAGDTYRIMYQGSYFILLNPKTSAKPELVTGHASPNHGQIGAPFSELARSTTPYFRLPSLVTWTRGEISVFFDSPGGDSARIHPYGTQIIKPKSAGVYVTLAPLGQAVFTPLTSLTWTVVGNGIS